MHVLSVFCVRNSTLRPMASRWKMGRLGDFRHALCRVLSHTKCKDSANDFQALKRHSQYISRLSRWLGGRSSRHCFVLSCRSFHGTRSMRQTKEDFSIATRRPYTLIASNHLYLGARAHADGVGFITMQQPDPTKACMRGTSSHPSRTYVLSLVPLSCSILQSIAYHT